MAASYPTSVKTFTAKATNDVIEASHVNDLQDEVNAIESNLLNGLAHALTPDATANNRDLGSSARIWRALYAGRAIFSGVANEALIEGTGYSLTGSDASALADLAGTWNTTGLPTAIKLNITDTASNANSILLDLQIGGASKFRVYKGGDLELGNGLLYSGTGLALTLRSPAGSGISFQTGGANSRWGITSTGHLEPNANVTYNIGSVAAQVLGVYAGSAYIGDGSSASPSLRFSSSGNENTGLYLDGTDSPGITTNGTARWSWRATGHYAPVSNNLYTLGTSTERTSNVYSVLGDFSGALSCATIDTGSGAVELAAGTYTPTLTNVTNVAASTAYECQYLRVGNTVTVSGQIDVDPITGSGTLTEVGISLPIASNFGAVADCGGASASTDGASESAAIQADATNDRAKMLWYTVIAANHTMTFTFTYQVI